MGRRLQSLFAAVTVMAMVVMFGSGYALAGTGGKVDIACVDSSHANVTLESYSLDNSDTVNFQVVNAAGNVVGEKSVPLGPGTGGPVTETVSFTATGLVHGDVQVNNGSDSFDYPSQNSVDCGSGSGGTPAPTTAPTNPPTVPPTAPPTVPPTVAATVPPTVSATAPATVPPTLAPTQAATQAATEAATATATLPSQPDCSQFGPDSHPIQVPDQNGNLVWECSHKDFGSPTATSSQSATPPSGGGVGSSVASPSATSETTQPSGGSGAIVTQTPTQPASSTTGQPASSQSVQTVTVGTASVTNYSGRQTTTTAKSRNSVNVPKSTATATVATPQGTLVGQASGLPTTGVGTSKHSSGDSTIWWLIGAAALLAVGGTSILRRQRP